MGRGAFHHSDIRRLRGTLDLPPGETATSDDMGAEVAMLRLRVSGMTCGHCVSAVTSAVRTIEQAAAVSVDLSSGAVDVHGDPDGAAIIRAIANAGYSVTNAASSAGAEPADPIVSGRKSCCCG